ncbi:NAC domain-containing protein 82-like isoform X1 [Cornus florida]|uniref:NAC domain-containing protein 82-like isoform X1 n=1 Tax=Cornus florida TaxID=4283 RepID=UPI00289C1C84|nr:NAC domain-containing protein 82-like isoform X1 [Cornus florida]
MERLSLSPGFRFHPTDVELVMFYLKRKVLGRKFKFEVISEVNIYKFGPWDLPDKSCLPSKDREWYFFCPRERKYASGSRASRSTENGYWKATGKDRTVLYNEQAVGTVKTLVFHVGRAPKGERSDWVIHEYRIDDKGLAEAGVVQDAFVICKIFKKSGSGPNNGAQYGAPFNEEDWSDDEEDDLSPEALVLPDDQNSASLFEASPSHAVPSEEVPQPLLDDDDLGLLLAMFVDDGDLLSSENENVQLSNIDLDKRSKAVSSLDGNDIYGCLGDLGNWSELDGGGLNFSNCLKTDCSSSSIPSFYNFE